MSAERWPAPRRRTLLAALAVAATSGCVRVPTSGPVERVAGSSPEPIDRGVQVRPVPPRPDAGPEVVLAGFIEAMASLEPGFQVARQYLTDKAADSWDPNVGVTIFDGDRRTNRTTARSAVLQAPLVGRLDAGGHFQSVTGTLEHDFGMQQVDGQWRISRPPKGLLVSRYTLRHRFTPAQLWFLDLTGSRVVPEQVWLAAYPASATQLVQALLAGPSDWLRPAATSAIPADVRLAAPAVTVDEDGTAEVSFTNSLATLPEAQRSQVMAQLVLTLTQLLSVRRVLVRVEGQAWAVPGIDLQVGAGESDVVGYLPVGQDVSPRGLVVADKRVQWLDEPAQLTPVGGAFGGPWRDAPRHIAATLATNTLAVVGTSSTRLWIGGIDEGEPTLALAAKAIRRPQFDHLGRLWVVAGNPGQLHMVDAERRVHVVDVALPPGHTLEDACLSPAGTVLAVLSRAGDKRLLGQCVVHGQPLRATGYRSVPVDDSLRRLEYVVDLGWTGPGRMIVLAATDRASRCSAYALSSDGASLVPLGPSGDAEPAALAVHPARTQTIAMVRTQRSRLLRHEAAWRWAQLEPSVAAFCYPR